MATDKSKIEKLTEELSSLSVMDMAELKKALEEKWGVEAAAPVAVAAPAGGAAAEEKEEESTEFDVTLQEAPADKKISIIKVVRELTGLGLKEAKELVESAPKPIKQGVPKAEADSIVEQIKKAGGKASSKGV